MIDPLPLLEPLRELHDSIRGAIVSATEKQELEELSGIERDDAGDTVYAIDAISEEMFVGFLERLGLRHSFVLIAEGLEKGPLIFPHGTEEGDATWRIIVDPIDGTRGFMYQKRSGWILTGVAANRGKKTGLQDIVLSIQTEIPLLKQHLSDQMWAIKGQGVTASRYDRLTGVRTPLQLRPSSASSIAHGFATIARFFPGGRGDLAEIDDEVAVGALGPIKPDKAHCFEDQYISTGGQLYELIAGHDRFIADLRPLIAGAGLCCHPYDLCSALIATELGIVVTDPLGNPLNAPLDVGTDVAWVGYANEQIRRQVEPLLQAALRKRGWI